MTINLRRLGIGLSAFIIAVTASAVGQLYTKTFAANTLSGINEVIQIATTDGQPPNQLSEFAGISGDGNVVLFQSKATNLPDAGGVNYGVHGGTYTYNITTNTTTRMDVSDSGAPANQLSSQPLISENGRYVLFVSRATNLIDGQTLYLDQPYIRDVQAGTMAAASNHYSDGSYPDTPLGISNDGRFVLIGSRYIAADAYHDFHAVLGDRTTGSFVWRRLEESNSPTAIDFNAGGMSCDGSFLIYDYTTNSIARDVRDTTSIGSVITPMHGISPIISCNGNYMLYATTGRTDISPTPSGMSQYMHLVEYNRLTGDREYIDSDNSGNFDSNTLVYAYGSYARQNPNAFSASVADTGDVVLKYNGNYYLKHLSDGSGTLEPVAKTLSGSYVNVSTFARITSDGRYVFFTADPYDLGIGTSSAGLQIIRAKTNL